MDVCVASDRAESGGWLKELSSTLDSRAGVAPILV